MRTTLTIDDAVLSVVKRYAEGRRISLGKAVTDLLRRALSTDCPTTTVNGLTVIDPGRAGVVSAGRVRRLIEDEGL